MVIVALTGHAGSGKSTLANALVELGWEEYSFAAPLRALALKVNPIARLLVRIFGEERAKRIFPSVRHCYQTLGQGVRDTAGEDCWINALEQSIDSQPATGRTGVVISDLRYANEAAWVKKRGGMVFRVNRDGIGPVNDHISEKVHDIPVDDEIHAADLAELNAWAQMIDRVRKIAVNTR